MKREWLAAVCRLALAMWVGGGLFFVYVTLTPVRSTAFDSTTKSRMVIEVFPSYYKLGFVLVAVAAIAGALSWGLKAPNWKHRVGVVLAWGTLCCMVYDWFWIYRPLEKMIVDILRDGGAPPLEFRAYHTASWMINAVAISLSMLAIPFLFCPHGPTNHEG